MGEKSEDVAALSAPFAHLEHENRERIAHVLCRQVPEVFLANRTIERRTGYSSEIGQNMLVDVLSHLGTLASRSDLSREEEATQLAKIEEHLRRALIEHPEEVVRDRLVDVQTLWSEYVRESYVYREQGRLRGVPRHKALEEKRTRIDLLMEAARSVKPDETTWDESLNAAADMTEAANLAAELADELEACIGAAQRITKEREQESLDVQRDATATQRDRKSTALAALGIVVALALFFAGGVVIGGGKSTSHATHAAGSPKSKTLTVTVTVPTKPVAPTPSATKPSPG